MRAIVFRPAVGHGASTLPANLRALGWEVTEHEDVAEVVSCVERGACDLVAIGAAEGMNRRGVALARTVRERDRSCIILLLSEASSEDFAIDALRAGVSDLLSANATAAEIGASLARLTRTAPVADETILLNDSNLVGDSSAWREVRMAVARAASNDSNVLITGETGTGKELVAALIHSNSARAKRPMICINSAAVPDTLLESELFGYERGAFTGAHTSNSGKLEQADGGTVFFDEIGDMSPYAQAKILRAVESRQVQRLGGRQPIALDVRIISATNRDLDSLAMDDRFRRDLYFRLNVVRIHLPPIRERKADIPPLVDHYIREFNRSFRANVDGLDGDTLDRFLAYSWPGNIRELKNVLESVFSSRPAARIHFLDLPGWLRQRMDGPPQEVPQPEQDRILSALVATNWNKSKAAEKLAWSRMTLYRKMAKYQLDQQL